MLYNIILGTHNIVRWLVLAAAVWALIRTYGGWLGARAWTSVEDRASFLFTTAFDMQVLLGAFLAAVSPLTQAAMANLRGLMGAATLRFFFVEHIPTMVLALIVVHATSVVARRTGDDGARFKRSALGTTLALVMVAVAVPWWRPLLPGL